MNRKISILIMIAVVLSIYGCSSAVDDTAQLADDSQATAGGVESVVKANNQFALELYSEIKDENNIFFSPYSISSALAITYEGAKGQTAEEIQSVFHFPADESVRRPSFASIYNQINKKDREYKLSTANALWAQEDYPFLDDYMNTIERYYGGKTANLNFITETEKSRVIINDWVEDQTNNKIKDLIPLGTLGSMTRLVITNAVYFKGNWAVQFDEDDTFDQDFRISQTETVNVPMMSLTGEDAEFNYAETDELQILEMPYEGGELSMLVLLPKDMDMVSVEDSLNSEKLSELKSSLAEQQVDVYMPKFTFETKYFMTETLAKMGMPAAFSENADFSGMDGGRNLFISAVIHQAFVEVNEEGTEAAAATAVVMKITAALPSIEFRADHPFIFIIQERNTGNILFLGKVVNPVV